MKRKQKKFTSILALFLCISVSLPFPLASVHAIVVDDITDGATNHAASTLERRYHLNLQSLQDQGENLNVSSQKGRAPEVLLYFSPTDPKPGMDVEARAFPEFFANAADTLYFTWYLKRKGCGLDDGPVGKEKRLLCDRNDDGKITVEDWKIEAMQIIAARNFDSTCSLNGGLSADERAECAENMYDEDAPSRINPSGDKGRDRDEDGYVATFGGDGRSNVPSGCTSSGSGSTTTPADDGFVPSTTDGYGLFLSTDGTGTNTTLTISPSQTLYEKTSGYDDTSEFCIEESGTTDCSGESGNWRMATEFIGSGDAMTNGGGVWTRIVSPVTQVFESGKIYHLYWRDNSVPAISSTKLIISGSSSGGGSCSGSGSACYIHDFGDGYNYELSSCRHLFSGNYSIDGSGSIRRSGEIAGNDDRGFPIDEEHFWRTDPEDPSTAQNGNKDEANLAGLGQKVFKWTYAPEDMVGVAVEGASMYSTKYDNASTMIMWALPKNKCTVGGKSTRSESIKGYSVAIKTATTNINDCLEDNLVDPTEGGQSENLDLSLAFSPEEPSAKLIPWGDANASAEAVAQTGDTLSLRASSSNARHGSSFTNYTWRVQVSSDGTFNTRFNEENVWVDITSDLKTAKNIISTNGNNLPSISMDLNLNDTTFTDLETGTIVPGFGEYFKDDVAYFRVSVSAVENFNEEVSQSGVASAVIKVVANKSIDVSGTDPVVGSTGDVRVKRNDTVFCAGSTFQQTICPVLNHQIIGVNLDASGDDVRDYSWTLNGQPLTCTSRVSSECSDEKQGSVNFFPVSGKVGDMYVLSVAANNSETGRSFTVSRRFQVVDPDFDIISEDTETAWSKYLGKYVNLDGTEAEDMSKTSFEGIPGSVAKFSAVFRPEALGTFVLDGIKAGDDQNEMIWSINGKPFKWNDTGLSISLDGNVGDIYTVTLSGAYNQPRELRKALYDIWKISPFSSETVRFSKEIQVRLVVAEGGQGENARGKTNTFFASIISAVPPFVIFSVRLILSMGLILLIVGVAFSAMPEGRRENSE